MALNNLNFTNPGYSVPAEYDLEFFHGVALSILKGDSDNFTAVWIANGRLMIASAAALSIVNLETDALVSWYTQTHGGTANEVLTNDDIIDLVGS